MARLGIVFVAVMFAGKVTPGILVEEQWYEFFLALIFGGLNALIRSLIILNNWKGSWTLVSIMAVILNLFLYILVYAGVFSWLGVNIIGFGTIIAPTIIVSFVSVLCNHFKGFKTKIE
ncbi:MAG: hypothetical protein S4CHLAM6_08720 [Chlamydiae bacterium]|nr:hypothetical protein [Chlamydiota bacterium]